MYKWSLLSVSILFSASVNAGKSQEQLLKEFNKAYFEIHKQLIGKNLLERINIQQEKITEFSDNLFAQDVLKQLISTDQSVAGLHNQAISNYAYVAKNTKQLTLDLNGFKPVNAVSAILNKAKNHQVVMVNEAHHIAQHRVLTRDMLQGLWDQGFRYFAVEALAEEGASFVEKNHVSAKSGQYLEEPVYADLLITAKSMGFTLVSYDYGDKSSRKNREIKAVENLVDKIFSHDKDAKVLIHCGYSHIKEQDGWLADLLNKETGIDPFTINQTHIMEQSRADKELAIYQDAIKAIKDNEPVVFVSSEDYWSAIPNDYDVNVIWPRTTFVNGRPEWTKLDRQKLKIDASVCGDNLPCMIEVYDSSDEAALASDRILLSANTPEADVFVSDDSVYIKTTTEFGSKNFTLDKVDNGNQKQ